MVVVIKGLSTHLPPPETARVTNTFCSTIDSGGGNRDVMTCRADGGVTWSDQGGQIRAAPSVA